MTEAIPPAEGRHLPTHTVVIPPEVPMVSLVGAHDEMLRTIEREFPRLDVHVRGNEVNLTGPREEVSLVETLIDEMLEVIAAGSPINRDAIERSVHMLREQTRERPAEVLTQNIVSSRGRTIRPKTLGQKQYVDAIDVNTIVFGIGPAGTGKTYLAMAKAVAALQAKQVNRILLTRPAVEAGERLGFLPGTLTDKIDPYLRPLYDALHDMIDPESIPRLMASGTIEVAPLAYMRGRAQPVDTAVLTPVGWRRFGDLRVGDLVIGSDGMPTPVIGVYPQGVREVYRVSAQDGASTLACGEHLWTVRTKDDKRRGRWRTLRTDQMTRSLRSFRTHRYELPVVQPVEFVERDVPMHPYALGLLLGDGCLTTVETPEPAVAVGVRDRGGVEMGSSLEDTLWSLRLNGATRETCFVPELYAVNATWVRYALLAGLLDSTGGAVQHRSRSRSALFTTRSERLRDGVVDLVRSLGGVALDVRRADAYVLDIRLPEGLFPFGLDRKRAADDRDGGGRPQRYVHSIEPAGEAETMCIQVAAADSLYVTEDFLLTHNTLNDAFIILDEAQNTSAEQMKMFLTRLGFGSKMVVTGDVTQVDLPGGVTSGLRVVREILDGLDDVHFAELTAHDVVRHRLVGAIVDAYGEWDARQHARRPSGSRTGAERRSTSARRRSGEERPAGIDPA